MDILSLLRKTSRDTAECKYLLHNGIGYKAYFYEDDRDYAFKMQSLAFENGLGPEPYECIDIEEYYVYTTEHCGPTLGEIGIYDDIYEDIKQASYKLLDIGIDIIEDTHSGNFCLKDGNPICIDFGSLSCYES